MAVNTSRSQNDELITGATEMSVRQLRPDRGGDVEDTNDASHRQPVGYPYDLDQGRGEQILRGVVRGL